MYQYFNHISNSQILDEINGFNEKIKQIGIDIDSEISSASSENESLVNLLKSVHQI